MVASCLIRIDKRTLTGEPNINDHIGERSRYGYYKFFVSEDAKNDLLEYAPIARRKCDTPENHQVTLCKRTLRESFKGVYPYSLLARLLVITGF